MLGCRADFGASGAPTVVPKATPTVEFPPLTASERLRLYLTTTYGPLSIVHSAAAAGISQWRDAPKEWKQGAEAYGDRPFPEACTFVARNDGGQEHFAYSRFGSALGAAFISRTWQPPSRNGAGNVVYSFGITMANGIGWNVFREFWPDMRRPFKKH